VTVAAALAYKVAMKLWRSVRTTILTLSLTGAMTIGLVGGGASAAPPGDDAIDGAAPGCTAWACRLECAPFGGALVPGGPGKPLQCACCG
jgi:hypothetical protein